MEELNKVLDVIIDHIDNGDVFIMTAQDIIDFVDAELDYMKNRPAAKDLGEIVCKVLRRINRAGIFMDGATADMIKAYENNIHRMTSKVIFEVVEELSENDEDEVTLYEILCRVETGLQEYGVKENEVNINDVLCVILYKTDCEVITIPEEEGNEEYLRAYSGSSYTAVVTTLVDGKINVDVYHDINSEARADKIIDKIRDQELKVIDVELYDFVNGEYVSNK